MECRVHWYVNGFISGGVEHGYREANNKKAEYLFKKVSFVATEVDIFILCLYLDSSLFNTTATHTIPLKPFKAGNQFNFFKLQQFIPPQVSLLYRLIQYITYITFKKSSSKFSFFLCYLFIFIAITEFCGYRFLFSKFPQFTYCCANSCHDTF